MRSLVALSLIFSGAVVHASFEMMLITDPYGKAIHRFDPINRVSLGSFGTGMLNPNAVCVNQALNVAYVADGGQGIRAFNYFTGDLLYSVPVSGMDNFRSISTTPDGNLMVNDGTIVRKVNANTGATMATVTPYPSNRVANAYQRADGTFVLLTGNPTLSGTYVTFHNSQGLATSFSTIESSQTIGSNPIFGGIAFRGNDVVATLGFGTTFKSYVGTIGASFATLTSVVYSPQNSRALVSNPVFTHTNTAFYLERLASNGATYTAANTLGFPSEIHTPMPDPLNTTLVFGGYTSIAMVLAPEPMPFIAIGLGMVGILGRRKKRATR